MLIVKLEVVSHVLPILVEYVESHIGIRLIVDYVVASVAVYLKLLESVDE